MSASSGSIAPPEGRAGPPVPVPLPFCFHTMRLNNKVSIITGAAQGIGLATALKFAQEGAIVVLCDLRQGPVDEAVAASGAIVAGP